MWIDVTSEPVAIRLAGVLDESTGANLLSVVKDCVAQGRLDFDLDTSASAYRRLGLAGDRPDPGADPRFGRADARRARLAGTTGTGGCPPTLRHGHGVTDDRKTPPARVVETHISVLVFVGDRVYKLRKPVHFDFLDFTDRAVREADCRREVELNRRLAPDVYLGVADIVMEGEAIDHMVVMRALPDERRLATLVRAGVDVEAWLARVATTLAAFHAGARRSPAISEAGTEHALRAVWDANFEETRPLRRHHPRRRGGPGHPQLGLPLAGGPSGAARRPRRLGAGLRRAR